MLSLMQNEYIIIKWYSLNKIKLVFNNTTRKFALIIVKAET